MVHRLLILGAGTGASNNLIRSLRAGDASFSIVGCHHDRFVLKKSSADRNYLIPESGYPNFAAALRRVIEIEKIDLVIPNNDADVMVVSRLRNKIPCRLFLPRKTVIDLCQDKYALASFLRDHGLPAPLTYPVTDLAGIEELFGRLGSPSRVWCRVRVGTSSLGATSARSPEQARSWIEYWENMRGVPATSFTLSEYLPGRDFAAQGLWKEGTLILLKICERLSYFGGGNQPSGVSSTPALGKIVFDTRVAELCRKAVLAFDAKAWGVFSIDLK
jgi:carbamoyl-phosphate synthase large subunit